jgi:hypothetical protein
VEENKLEGTKKENAEKRGEKERYMKMKIE